MNVSYRSIFLSAAHLLVVLMCFLFTEVPSEEAGDAYYVCSAGDSKFLGKYLPGKEPMDGAPVYYNENDMAIFRNKKFW
jgi:hypothetical protein